MKNRIALSIVVLCLPDRRRRPRSESNIPAPGASTSWTSISASEWPDPYRWLEEDVRKSAAVADWVAAENKVTRRYLMSIPQREKIRRRITELWNFTQYGGPHKAGGRYYYLKNDGLQNQAVLYVMDSLDGRPRILLDPNTWSKDGTIALGGHGRQRRRPLPGLLPGRGGLRLAPLAGPGDRFRQALADELRWTKSPHASWSHDGRGFLLQPRRAAQARQRVPIAQLQQPLVLPPPRHAAARRRGGLLSARASPVAIRGDRHRGRPLPGDHHRLGNRRSLSHHREGPDPAGRGSPSS